MSPQLGSALVPPTGRRHRMWPSILLAALVVAIAGVTAVAPQLLSHDRSSHQDGNGSAVRYPASFDGALTTTRYLMSAQVELSSPPAGALTTVAVRWQQALDTCWTSGGLCDPRLTAHVYLADFTMAYSQPTARLAWIIDYPAERCLPYGHPPALSSSPLSTQPTITVYNCRMVNIIDSKTGALLWSLRDPTP